MVLPVSFDGREMKRLQRRRDEGVIQLVTRTCASCGHDRAFRYSGGRCKCTRCRGESWE